jgi:hypothetical protein
MPALEWAIKKDVDIISMSWTFNQKTHEDPRETADFKAKIEMASRKHILLFASLNDKEYNTDVANFYPVGMKEVFKIGSAKKWGANADFSVAGTAEYLFPGQEVELKDQEGETIHTSGSSLATAFAAGMAGLILFAMKLHVQSGDDVVPDEVKEKRLSEAKGRDGMAKIFNKLGGIMGSGNHSDVPVAFSKDLFPQNLSDLQSEKTRTLREFLAHIAPAYSG